MNIYVVRHGQTRLNEEGRMQGRNGEPLNKNGIKQAKKLSKELEKVKFDLVISSPQTRAIQTAIIISGKDPKIDKRIDVYDLGEADRMKKNEVDMVNFIPNPKKYKGVEKFEEFIFRIKSFMKDIENMNKDGLDNVLIIGHK